MADENKPAFYPRVGRNIAKNFRSAQPVPFIDDPRAMEMPQLGEVDIDVPTKANRELSERMGQRRNDLERQRNADMSPLEKVAGALEAVRFMGSALTQSINSLPTRIAKGDEAADKFIQERIYKPTQPKAYEYAQDIGDFLEKLETEYKIPPVLPEAMALQYLAGPATSQATRGALQAGAKLERSLDPMVAQALERGGLQRDLLLGLGQGTQSNVIKQKGGNWIDNSIEKVLDPVLAKGILNNQEIPYGPKFDVAIRKRIADLKQKASESDYIGGASKVAEHLERDLENPRTNEVALNKWIQNNLANYVKNEMGTPEDPVRLLIEKREAEINAKFALDQQRAQRIADRAEAEPDPRRKANLKRQSAQMMEEAEINREMATRHKSHLPPDLQNPESMWVPEELAQARKREGFPEEEIGKTPSSQMWEQMADELIAPRKASDISGSLREQNPWLEKLNPEESVYQPMRGLPQALKFDHILDVLRQDLAEGRIRPDQLNKINMEQAVRRTAEYDLERAKAMRDAQIKNMSGFPTYKEYPEGYKWIELTKPSLPEILPEGWSEPIAKGNALQTKSPNGDIVLGFDLPDLIKNIYKRHPDTPGNPEKKLEEALKYEGDTMGHCVGGYCPDVSSGETKIYSLRDSRGEPHVTVEVEGKPSWFTKAENIPDPSGQYKNFYQLIDNERNELAKQKGGFGNTGESFEDTANRLAQQYNLKNTPSIIQIKGKQNQRPIAKYDPYTQDFVKSGEWDRVFDLHNTGLVKVKNNQYVTEPEAKELFAPRIQQALDFLHTHPAFEEQRLARSRRDKDLFNLDYDQQRDLERVYGAPIYPNSPYSAVELAKIIKSPEENISSLGDWYPSLNKWLEEAEKGMEHYNYKPPAPPAPEMKRGGKVSISNNPDTMMLELNEQKMKNGVPAYGAGKAVVKKGLQSVPLPRAVPKTKAEIEAIAQRMAPQMLGEFVRGDKGTQSVAGKTQKQFAKEKEMVHDIRPTGAERPLPKTLDIEKLKDQVMVGIPGDPTISGQTLHSVAGVPLDSPSPQHGGPLYGLGHEGDAFWASGLGAANRVQNIAREASQQYDKPVLGNYVMMGPDSINYAQHYADANLAAIDLSKMSKSQIEDFNKLVREGYPYKKKGEDFTRQRVFPAFPGVENASEAYLHFSIDPELRKHFNALMQMPTITEKYNLPSGIDVRHAVTEPDLRDLEIGVTGKSIGRLRPEVTNLGLSTHPTYSHDIPGEFMGSSKYPVPYELSFPDTVKSVRENPKQAPQEFGSFKYVGPRQIIDQQLIDEIKQYEEMIKKYTGKKKGGTVKKAAGGDITGDDLIIEERPL